MRIALVAPLVSTIAQPYTGGVQAMLADLAQSLTRHGHAVTLFARQGSVVADVHIEQIPVPDSVQPASFAQPLQERPTNSGFFAQASLFLELFLQLRQRQRNFDLVHAHAFDWPTYACSALLTEIPVVHTLHLPAISPEINDALRILQRQERPLTLVTVSHACSRTYAEHIAIDAVIYNGVDLGAIPFSSAVPATAPLVFAGRIAPEKGVEAAIEIAERAGHRLIIAGGIYDQHYYETRIAPRIERSRARITYLGLLEHQALWEVMGQALGLLCPIEWDEPCALVPLEAQATGTPIIAYRRGCMPEMILHEVTGFLIEPGACDSAATHVASLAQLSRARCRAQIKQRFSLEQMIDAYEHLYADLVK
ncbi:MAG: glycosyltransferase [Chloroflexi bacterium]|nr:glycosyltransferase [Chloroflexota bacterium]